MSVMSLNTTKTVEQDLHPTKLIIALDR